MKTKSRIHPNDLRTGDIVVLSERNNEVVQLLSRPQQLNNGDYDIEVQGVNWNNTRSEWTSDGRHRRVTFVPSRIYSVTTGSYAVSTIVRAVA